MKNTIAIYKVTLLNNKHILECTLQTNRHNYLPIVFGQALDDGLGYNSKSFAQNLEDIQDVATTLVNAELRSTRRLLTDRGIYDPLLIKKDDINSPNPSAKIPLRSAAIGRKINEAYYPIPYEDRALGARMSQAAQLLSFGDVISGQNQVNQGQFVKGNKTNDQFQQSMAGSDNRLMAAAINIEDNFISVIKEITKQNILQFQGPAQKIESATNTQININPTQLQELEAQFRVSDGLIPSDRLANTQTLMVAAQLVASTPELALEYNAPKMLIHILQLQGIQHLAQYKLTPEEQQAKLEQMRQAALAQQEPGPANNQQPQPEV